MENNATLHERDIASFNTKLDESVKQLSKFDPRVKEVMDFLRPQLKEQLDICDLGEVLSTYVLISAVMDSASPSKPFKTLAQQMREIERPLSFLHTDDAEGAEVLAEKIVELTNELITETLVYNCGCKLGVLGSPY